MLAAPAHPGGRSLSADAAIEPTQSPVTAGSLEWLLEWAPQRSNTGRSGSRQQQRGGGRGRGWGRGWGRGRERGRRGRNHEGRDLPVVYTVATAGTPAPQVDMDQTQRQSPAEQVCE